MHFRRPKNPVFILDELQTSELQLCDSFNDDFTGKRLLDYIRQECWGQSWIFDLWDIVNQTDICTKQRDECEHLTHLYTYLIFNFADLMV